MNKAWLASKELVDAFNQSKVLKVSKAFEGIKFSRADIEAWLNFANPQPEDCFFVVNNQKTNLPVRFYNSKLQGGNKVLSRIDKTQVSKRIKTDASLVIKNFEALSPVAFDLALTVGQALQSIPHGNLYLTPKNIQTFDRHNDPHDIVILQLHGTKAWIVEDLGSVELNPGDMLFIPRGKNHEARALDESIHLSLGLYPIKLIDIISSLESTHKALPLKASHQLDQLQCLTMFKEISETLTNLTDEAINALILKALVTRMKEEWIPTTIASEKSERETLWKLNSGSFNFVLSSLESLVITNDSAQIKIEGDTTEIMKLLIGPSSKDDWKNFEEVFQELIRWGALIPCSL